ncbi:MAG: ATP-binding cassette domain-containing protein [Candidatus Devosia euplotis]|nr:ATP-binding cassette domain-containing protein [Candidatus Devosia euplotis]
MRQACASVPGSAWRWSAHQGVAKTTLARIIVGLDSDSTGQITLSGQAYHGADLPRNLRRDISLVFQDPFGSFNPRLTIGASLAEPLRLDPVLRRQTVPDRLVEATEAVGLDADMLERYPHAFSGCQHQRLSIARALVTRPKLVVLDEPVSALGMSVRGDVLSLLARLQAEYGLTYLIISHDLDMASAMADRVLVMGAGRIIEEGKPAQIFAQPQHRLTRDLAAARLSEVTPAGADPTELPLTGEETRGDRAELPYLPSPQAGCSVFARD